MDRFNSTYKIQILTINLNSSTNDAIFFFNIPTEIPDGSIE